MSEYAQRFAENDIDASVLRDLTGQDLKGLNCLAEAAQIVETTDEPFSGAALHRLRGDLLNAAGNRAAAERSYPGGYES
jgi:predicted negative regulator of RcsB-dependent stress response